MTRGKRLGLLFCGLVAASGAAYWGTQYNPEEKDTEQTETTIIYAANTDSVSEITWNYMEETLSFEKKEDIWSYVEDEKFPLDESYIDNILETLNEVTSDKVIESPDSLADYGLDPAQNTISVTDENGQTNLLIGNETSIDDKVYCSTGDGKVYLIPSSILDSFSHGLYELIKIEEIPNMEDVTAFNIEAQEGELAVEYSEDLSYDENDGAVWCLNLNGEKKPLDTDQTTNLLANITELDPSVCVDYYMEDEEKEEYGFGEGEWKVSVSYKDEEEKNFSIIISSTGDYMHLEDSHMVYEMDKTVSDELYQATYVSLMDKNVVHLDWEEITQISIAMDGEEYEIVRKTEESEVNEESAEYEDEENEEKAVITTYLLNDREISFQEVEEAINSLKASEPAEAVQAEKKEEIYIRFTKQAKDVETELSVYQYDSEKCLVVIDGKSTVFVPRTSVVSLKESVNTMILQ